MSDNIDELSYMILKLTQEGIPFSSSPFADIAEELGISEQEVVDRLELMQKEGFIRRFGASIAHRQIGINANAMCVWNVPDESVEKVGEIMASFPEVTHCYERPRYPNWPYNMFTMVHSYSRDECIEVATKISEAVGIDDYSLLFSEREFKKTGVRL
ncbi:DNA-binding Lrp family transcriptional regulator [Methanohalophilus levihalophilus]|uniref:siroheme decarboxylase subunit beta n=1 Tax=Methanohalophilus levihalophilus TaxID=1431282 RepID=UPI001AE5DDE9|nr:siroheme decarboxylase subunit beta [Methanohalophilus levihalophilus]MBP2031051.1 DNA-binding Lrp family transcriptional regulator [Methanohalophilus levihalophilus]